MNMTWLIFLIISWPDQPFHNSGAWKSVARRSGISKSSPISWAWRSKIVKESVRDWQDLYLQTKRDIYFMDKNIDTSFSSLSRWMQGIYMVVRSPTITWKSKFLLSLSLASWLTLPLTTLNLFLSPLFPMSLGVVPDVIMTYVGAMGLLMYGYGYMKQFPVQRWVKCRRFSCANVFFSSLHFIELTKTRIFFFEKCQSRSYIWKCYFFVMQNLFYILELKIDWSVLSHANKFDLSYSCWSEFLCNEYISFNFVLLYRYSWIRTLLVIPEIILSSLLSIIVENTAVCTMWFGDWYDFYIVEKEVEEDTGSNNSGDDDGERKIEQIVWVSEIIPIPWHFI